VDLRPVRDTDPVIGISGKFKILKFSRKKANVVVSRRAFMEEERESSVRVSSTTSRRGTSSRRG